MYKARLPGGLFFSVKDWRWRGVTDIMDTRLMDVSFLKIQASGDDYICINLEKNTLEEKHLPTLAQKICDRRLGVGGEGLIIITQDEEHRISARVLSAQGTEGEECGAALQCAARYAFDSGLVTSKDFSIKRGQRSVGLEIIDSSNIRQDMGPPLALDGEKEIRELSDAVFTRSIFVDNHEYSCTPVVFEQPQAVLFVTGFGLSLQKLAKKIENNPLFPGGAGGVCFVRLFSREELQVRSFRRNEKELHACPKTAAASLVAAALNGFAEREAVVHLRGGDLFVQWEEATNHVYFTGPAEYVFMGNYYFEES
jgi:diaminopimelate epimerase